MKNSIRAKGDYKILGSGGRADRASPLNMNMKYSRTYLLLERRSVLHRVHNGIRNAGVQLSDGILDVQFKGIVIVVHRRDEPPDCFHIARPCEIQFVRRLCQAASATFTYICIFFISFFFFALATRRYNPLLSRMIITQVYQKFPLFSLSDNYNNLCAK